MITDYNKFIKINEEADFGTNKAANGLGGMFKKLLGGLVKNVADEFKQPLEDFSKKLGKEKDTKGMVRLVNQYLKKHREDLNTSLENTKTVTELIKTVDSNIRTMYASMQATIENFGDDKYTFEEIFSNAPERTKKLFSKPKKFDANVGSFSKDLILSFGKQYGITEEDIDLDALKESLITEAEVEAGVQLSEEEQIADAQGEELSEEDKQKNEKNAENLKKLKEDIVNWFDGTIYKNTTNSLDEVQKTGSKKPAPTDLESSIENIPNEVTQNKDSVRTMINSLTNADKQTLINVRNMLGLDKNDTPL